MNTDSRPAPSRALQKGSILGGKYRLDAPLGRGGSGRVFAATQLKLGRSVAIKVLRYDLEPASRRLYEHRFMREASRAGALQHPNVVTIHDYDREPDGTCYIVMELVRGPSLGQLLHEGPLEPELALMVFEHVARGLRASHEAGLVHRDVKPGNIILTTTPDGRDLAKLVDFGLVRSHADKRVTAEGVFLGTPNYVAPEQARGGEADPRSDIYSLGIVLYRALTGALPYSAPSPVQVVMAHLREPYPRMRDHSPLVPVPPQIEEIVRCCMEKDPKHRYQSAMELLRQIRAVRKELFGVADSLSGEGPLPVADQGRTRDEVRRSFWGVLTGWFGRPQAMVDPRLRRRRMLGVVLTTLMAGLLGGTLLALILVRLFLNAPAPEPVAPSVPLQALQAPQQAQPELPEASSPSFPVRTEHSAATPAPRRASSGSGSEEGFLFPAKTDEGVEELPVWDEVLE